MFQQGGYVSQQNPLPTNNNSTVGGGSSSSAIPILTTTITTIWLGTVSGALQGNGLGVGSIITLTRTVTGTVAQYEVTGINLQNVNGFLYDVTHISGFDFSVGGQPYEVCIMLPGPQGPQGPSGPSGGSGSDLYREIVKSSFRSELGLPRYFPGNQALSNFVVGTPKSSTADGGGWNSSTWPSTGTGSANILGGINGIADGFSILGNGIPVTRSYAINDQISIRGSAVGAKLSGAYTAGTTQFAANLYKHTCGIGGDGQVNWTLISVAPVEGLITYQPYIVGGADEGRASVCFNGAFLLDEPVSRWNERLMVGFASDIIGSNSFGGNDVIISYVLFDGIDPQP